MSQEDTDQFSFTWTRRQLQEVRSALKKRREFLKQGVRRGTADEQDVVLIEALLADIAMMLRTTDPTSE